MIAFVSNGGISCRDKHMKKVLDLIINSQQKTKLLYAKHKNPNNLHLTFTKKINETCNSSTVLQ